MVSNNRTSGQKVYFSRLRKWERRQGDAFKSSRRTEEQNHNDYLSFCLCHLPVCSQHWPVPIWPSQSGRKEKPLAICFKSITICRTYFVCVTYLLLYINIIIFINMLTVLITAAAVFNCKRQEVSVKLETTNHFSNSTTIFGWKWVSLPHRKSIPMQMSSWLISVNMYGEATDKRLTPCVGLSGEHVQHLSANLPSAILK